jgi:hypothetical protein
MPRPAGDDLIAWLYRTHGWENLGAPPTVKAVSAPPLNASSLSLSLHGLFGAAR